MKKTLPLTGFLIAGMLMLTDTSFARGVESSHTLGSGPDVYRIEVRNLTKLEVMETGDSDGTGELHEVVISLYRGYQSHSKSENATPGFLYNDTTNDGGNHAYLNVRKGNRVILHGRANHDNLWIHAKTEDRSGARSRIHMSVRARELDCARKRVCKRGGRGGFYMTFIIPNFATPPSTRCGPENTFKLTRIDDEIGISGLDDVTNHSSNIISGTGDRIILRPLEADICIASTSRARRTPPPPSGERFMFLKNLASDRCLTMPRRGMTGASVSAQVNTCHFASSVGSPHQEKWQLVGTAPSTYFIRSSQGNYCLNLKTSVDNRQGGPVKIVNCSGHNDQKWTRREKGNGQFELRHVPSGKCLNVHGREHKTYGQISVYTCAETPDQRWAFTDERTANDIAALERRR